MDSFSHYLGDFQGTSWLFQRGLSAIYLIGFVCALKQFPALLGENGLLPVPEFIRAHKFMRIPSIFHIRYSDAFFRLTCWLGIAMSSAMLLAIPDHLPWFVSTVLWLLLWVIYLSIVNIGQTFFGFGWESMLLEAGFFAAFLGPGQMVAQAVPFAALKWMLFRVELGAGLIKLRHDKCWRDLTCLYYHYETQPIPNPMSWFFHRLPKIVHRVGVAFSHFVQVALPFGLFAPQPFSSLAGALIIFHQLLLIVSGNYSWLNWITVVLGLTALSDSVCLGVLGVHVSVASTALTNFPAIYETSMVALGAVIFLLSVQPTMNLFSKNQRMNSSYNSIHLINNYGAFGSMSRQRFEVIIEGTLDEQISNETVWTAYEFKAKVGDINRMPPQVAPYHLRLDWMMWFIPFSTSVRHGQVVTLGYERWFIRLVSKLLESDKQTLALLRGDPFSGTKPSLIRAQYFLYEYTTAAERTESGAWWRRTLLGTYLPPVSLASLERAGLASTARW